MNFADIMQAIADAVSDADIDGIGERCFGWPVASAPVPCFIVGYPEGTIDLNATMGAPTGSLIRGTYQAWWLVGNGLDRTGPEDLGSKIRGIKEAVDGDLGGAAESALVLTAEVQPVTVGAVEHLAVRFAIDVVSTGGADS